MPATSCHPPALLQGQLFKHSPSTVPALSFPTSPTLQTPPASIPTLIPTTPASFFPRSHKQQPEEITRLFFHLPLKTALSVMPTSYEVWLRGMRFAVAIVCRNDDRGGGTAESSQKEKGTERKTDKERACHQTKKSYFLAP